MNLPIWALRIGAMFLHIKGIDALRCYDSSDPEPYNIIECDHEYDVCYSEFYMVRRAFTNTTVKKINRFCLHMKHCQYRGFYGGCSSFDDLDGAVQQTFRRMINFKIKSMEILHTRFCCCTQDLCNSMSPEEVLELFNVTSSAYSLNQHVNSVFDCSILFVLSIFYVAL